MNKIYNTYKASEEGFEKMLTTKEAWFENLGQPNWATHKSFNRTTALALLESVKDFLTKGSPSRLDMLNYVEQAEQLIKQ